MHRQNSHRIFEPINKGTIQARMDDAARVLDLPLETLSKLYSPEADADETLTQQRYNFQHDELCHYGNDGLAWETFTHNLLVCLHQAVHTLFQYHQAACLKQREQFNALFATVANIGDDNTLTLSSECQRLNCTELQTLLTRLCYPNENMTWDNTFLFQYLSSFNLSHGLTNYIKCKTIIFTKNKSITFDDSIHDLEDRKKKAAQAAKKIADVIAEKMKPPVSPIVSALLPVVNAAPFAVNALPQFVPAQNAAPTGKTSKTSIFKMFMLGFCFVIGIGLITASIVFSGGIAAIVLGIAGVLAIGAGTIGTGMMLNKGKPTRVPAYFHPMMMSTGLILSLTNSEKRAEAPQKKTVETVVTIEPEADSRVDDSDLQFPPRSPALRK